MNAVAGQVEFRGYYPFHRQSSSTSSSTGPTTARAKLCRYSKQVLRRHPRRSSSSTGTRATTSRRRTVPQRARHLTATQAEIIRATRRTMKYGAKAPVPAASRARPPPTRSSTSTAARRRGSTGSRSGPNTRQLVRHARDLGQYRDFDCGTYCRQSCVSSTRGRRSSTRAGNGPRMFSPTRRRSRRRSASKRTVSTLSPGQLDNTQLVFIPLAAYDMCYGATAQLSIHNCEPACRVTCCPRRRASRRRHRVVGRNELHQALHRQGRVRLPTRNVLLNKLIFSTNNKDRTMITFSWACGLPDDEQHVVDRRPQAHVIPTSTS